MDRDSGVFATIPWAGKPEPWALWSAPEKRLLAKADYGGFPENVYGMAFDPTRRRMLMWRLEGDRSFVQAMGFDGATERLGTLPFDPRAVVACTDFPDGRWFAVSDLHDVFVIEIGDHELSEPRRLDHIKGPISDIECDPLGRFIAAHHEDGRIRMWDLEGQSPPRVIQGPSRITGFRITSDGSFLHVDRIENREVETWIWSLETERSTLLRNIDLGRAGGVGGWTLNPAQRQIVSILNPDPMIRLWPLGAPADAAPVIMQRGNAGAARRVEIHPSGGWLADSGTTGLTLWPVARSYPIAIGQYEERMGRLVFGPGGRWLASSSFDRSGTVRVWQLEGDNLPPARIVYEAKIHAFGIAASPDGRKILLGDQSGTVKLLSFGDEDPVDLPGVVAGGVLGVAISSDGRFAAASGVVEDPMTRVIRVWDLASLEEVTTLDLGDRRSRSLQFTKDGHLLSGGDEGLVRWDLVTGESETLFEEAVAGFAVNSGETRVLLSQAGSERASLVPYGRAVFLDLMTGLTTPLAAHGDRVTTVATDAGGTIAVTGGESGVVRVGPITGEEPHMLVGNPDEVYDVAIDPSGRWIASSSGTEVRLWPMPDLSKPPLHTLPHDELIAKLKTLTNLRVVRDETSSTGWKLEVGPFPGWETVPTW
jgi:WD40 repeat protein